MQSEEFTFPGTTRISLQPIATLNSESEVFSFSIQPLNTTDYLENFIQKLDEYLPPAILSLNHIKTIQDRQTKGISTATILEEARKFLKKCKEKDINSYGELGEVLLYIFAKEVKSAHKLVSKFMHRDKRNHNILGRDSIFGLQSETGDIYMLIGEAKTIDSGNDGLREAQTDLNAFWANPNDFAHEIQLASSHIREEISEENLPIYEAYFVEGSDNHANLKYKNIIFVGFNCESLQKLIKAEIDENNFVQYLQAELAKCFENQKVLIESSPCANIYCFIPFVDLKQARLFFAKHNGLIIP